MSKENNRDLEGKSSVDFFQETASRSVILFSFVFVVGFEELVFKFVVHQKGFVDFIILKINN